ncbi:MAG: type II secretion system protein [Bacilli bacterium]|nr:type II secretion system protein [Bacilli bacterium]
MSKKGFTLTEVLAIIVVITILGLIAVPAITNSIKNNNRDSYNSMVNDIVLAAQTYASNNGGVLKQISVTALQDAGYLGVLINPIDNTELKGCVYVVDGTPAYKEESCKTIISGLTYSDPEYTVYTSGQEVYFNVTTGFKCTKKLADKNINDNGTPTGIKEGCMRFFVLSDSPATSQTVTMILDHNTTPLVMWRSGLDTSLGPTQVLEALLDDTSEWNNTIIPNNYTFTFDDGTSYTIPYEDGGYKARLATLKDFNVPNTRSDYTLNNPNFYINIKYANDDNLYNKYKSTFTNNINGYWTADALATTTNNCVRTIEVASNGVGSIKYNRAPSHDYAIGVRPVIEVHKDILE